MLSGLSHIISWGATWDYKLQGLHEKKLSGIYRLYRKAKAWAGNSEFVRARWPQPGCVERSGYRVLPNDLGRWQLGLFPSPDSASLKSSCDFGNMGQTTTIAMYCRAKQEGQASQAVSEGSSIWKRQAYKIIERLVGDGSSQRMTQGTIAAAEAVCLGLPCLGGSKSICVSRRQQVEHQPIKWLWPREKTFLVACTISRTAAHLPRD